jgi:hypothetical protein
MVIGRIIKTPSVAYFEDGLHLGQLRPRVFSGKHFNHQATHAPYVRFVSVGCLFHNLRCHPKHRSLQRRPVHPFTKQVYRSKLDTVHREKASAPTVLNFLRYAEIRYFNPTFIVHKDVSTFDISMDDVPFVQIIQALENLANEILNEGFLKSSVIA